MLFFLIIATLIKTWPVIRQKVNEARQIELEGDNSLRGDLLKRIADLEGQLGISQAKSTADRIHYDSMLEQERKRCDEALGQLRREMQSNYDGLMRQFIAAQMAWAQAIPPHQRSPEINAMLSSLTDLKKDDPNA